LRTAGTTELTQTRLFRGKVLSVIAAGHLYHLEHHLYPQVPHHHWPQLARRLDPHFARLEIEPVTLLF
jgi:beta-carotene hydroxylase